MMNIQKMMQQAQQVQFKLQELQEKMKDDEVQGESGGGLVKVIMSGDGRLKSVTLDPAIVISEDKETLEDLIVAGVNNAHEARETYVQEETARLMKDLGLPEGAAGQLPF